MMLLFILCVDTTILTVAVLLEELKEVDDWYMLGAYLNVPIRELKKQVCICTGWGGEM